MRPLLPIVALVCVVAAAWLYLRSPSGAEGPVEPAVSVTAALDLTQSDETGSLERPVDPIPREATALPTAPSVPEPELVVSPSVSPTPITPDAIELLQLEQDRLRKTLGEISTPILQRKFENGEATFLHAEQSYKGGKNDNAEIFMIHMDPNRGTFRTDITRAERPDLYVMKDRANAIKVEIGTIERERALAAIGVQPK